MQEITQGSVADGSITLAKLAAEVTAVALGGAAASHTHGAGDIASGTLEYSRIPVLDASKLDAGSVGSSQLASSAVTTQKIKDTAVTADKLAALAVLTQNIANGAVTTKKLASGAVTADKIAAITITADKLADNIPYTKFGLSAEQVRHIYTGTSETPPAGWQPGDIYLQYSV